MPYVKCDRLIVPKDEQVVWRYMNLPKFISILEDKKLYFPSLKKLSNSDKFEGLYPNFDVKSIPLFRELKEKINDGRDFARNYRQHCYVNCWHMNDSESLAMWKVYSGSEESIAIKTKFQCLKNALSCATQDIYASEVEYDDSPAIGTRLYIATRKRTPFTYERELRLIYEDIPCNPEGKLDVTLEPVEKGHYIQVDVKQLLKNGNIIISPTSGSWFKRAIEKLMDRYNLPANIVTMSELADEPI